MEDSKTAFLWMRDGLIRERLHIPPCSPESEEYNIDAPMKSFVVHLSWSGSRRPHEAARIVFTSPGVETLTAPRQTQETQ